MSFYETALIVKLLTLYESYYNKINGECVFFQIYYKDIIYYRLEYLYIMAKWYTLETQVVG